MTYRILEKTLRTNGVCEIDCIGKEYDANLHDALLTVDDPSKEPNTICEVATKGYVVGERVLRPAKVIVVKARA